MARKRSLDDGPGLRELIMSTASQLFYERGYGSTSIRDIAEATGISSSTMYHHFKDKQDVLNAVVSTFMTDFVAATVPCLHDTDRSPLARLDDVVRRHIELSDDRRPELLVGNPIRYALQPAQKQANTALQQTYHDAVRDLITEGAAAGVFVCGDVGAELSTMAVLDMLNGIREWFSPTGGTSRDEVVRHYQVLVRRLLGCEGADPG